MARFISSKFLWSFSTFIFFSGIFLGSEGAHGKFFSRSEEDAGRDQRIPQQTADFQLGFQAEEILLQRGDPEVAIALGRQVIDLEPESTELVGQMFNAYSYTYFTGDEDHPRNLAQAFELCLEAGRMGCMDCGSYLELYTRAVLFGRDGFEQDVSAALVFYRRAVTVGIDQALIAHIRGEFRLYTQSLISDSKSYKEAIDLLRALHGIEPDNDPHTKNLAQVLVTFSTAEFFGTSDVSQNVDEAIQFCREAVRLGSREAVDKLAEFSVALFKGERGVASDRGQAITVLKEALMHDDNPGGKILLGRMLKEYALEVLQDSKEERSKMEEAIALMQESADLGNGYAARLLPQFQAFVRSHSMGT